MSTGRNESKREIKSHTETTRATSSLVSCTASSLQPNAFLVLDRFLVSPSQRPFFRPRGEYGGVDEKGRRSSMDVEDGPDVRDRL